MRVLNRCNSNLRLYLLLNLQKKKKEYLDKINRDKRHLEEVKKNQDVGSGNNSNLFSLIFEFRLSPERFTN